RRGVAQPDGPVRHRRPRARRARLSPVLRAGAGDDDGCPDDAWLHGPPPAAVLGSGRIPPEPLGSDQPARSQHHPHWPPIGPIRVAAAVVWHEGRLLLTQRPPGGPLGLQWEMPGGKIEPGETPEHALVREISEELGVRATPWEVLGVESHDYPHGLEVEIVFL